MLLEVGIASSWEVSLLLGSESWQGGKGGGGGRWISFNRKGFAFEGELGSCGNMRYVDIFS